MAERRQKDLTPVLHRSVEAAGEEQTYSAKIQALEIQCRIAGGALRGVCVEPYPNGRHRRPQTPHGTRVRIVVCAPGSSMAQGIVTVDPYRPA